MERVHENSRGEALFGPIPNSDSGPLHSLASRNSPTPVKWKFDAVLVDRDKSVPDVTFRSRSAPSLADLLVRLDRFISRGGTLAVCEIYMGVEDEWRVAFRLKEGVWQSLGRSWESQGDGWEFCLPEIWI